MINFQRMPRDLYCKNMKGKLPKRSNWKEQGQENANEMNHEAEEWCMKQEEWWALKLGLSSQVCSIHC